MPTTLKFGKLFGKSSFKPMKEHMEIANECAGHMPAATKAFLENNKSSLKEIKRSVNQLESDADKVLEELQRRLSKSMFLPVERRDLLDVMEMQEAIADCSENIVGLMLDLPMEVPNEMHQPILALAGRVADAVSAANDVIGMFDDLVETGFKGPILKKTRALIRDVIEIETDADHIGTDITHTLFQHSKDMDPVSIVFLYRLINLIEDLADYAEALAIRSRLLLAG